MPTHMPGVFPDRSPDDIDADMADKAKANAEKARRRQAEEAAGEDDDDPHLQKPDNTTHPLNPPAERNSQIVAERDERPGS
jgi:hypothetical protein